MTLTSSVVLVVESIMAITEYVERDNASKFASFVELYPMTGRKHQLRVHCASALHTPIIGDEKYGAGVSSHLAQALGPDIPLQLHSRAIVLPYSSGKGSFTLDRGRVRVEAPLPDHMVRVWNYFGWKTS
jgi:23S rRNA pseudouridine955/2504/2580 synthase